MKAIWLKVLPAVVMLTGAGRLPAETANPPTAPAPEAPSATAVPSPAAATSPAPASASPAAAASPTAAASPAAAATPAPTALDSKKVQDALLIVTSKEGAGSGFMADLNGAPFLITNAHVISGVTRLEIKQLTGMPVQPGKGSLAVGADVAAFEAPPNLPKLELAKDVSKEVAIGDEVVIYGNSLGQSVATEIRGKVVGIGPDVVEVDAPFVPGNSGSPIIHVKSGKVIGIAAYVVTRKLDKVSENSGVAEVRRFGYRLDVIPRWDNMNWALFQSEATTVQGIEAFTDDYFTLIHDLRQNHGNGLSSQNPRIQRHIRDLQRSLESMRGRNQTADVSKAVTSFLWDLKSEAKQEFIPGRPVPRYWYTNHVWNKQKEVRDAISKDLDQSITERNTLSY